MSEHKFLTPEEPIEARDWKEKFRMRAALEELAKDGCVMGWTDGRTCLERPPSASKIVGICTGCIAMRALNPQPAQQESEARKALEDAPHDRNCNGAFGRDPLYPCDCWKSRALNPQPAQQEKA